MKLQTCSYKKIEWKKPVRAFPEAALAPSVGKPSEVTPDSLQLAVEQFGEPTAPGTPSEEARVLLEAAAEIEQQLMVEYLYAFFSTAASATWRRKLRTVFKEEMGHLLTVQNLLLLTRNPPHLVRMSTLSDPELPFPLRLEPVRTSSVAKYVAAESPDPRIAPPLPPDIGAQAKPAFEEASLAGFTGNRVGLLYAKIYWLLQKDETPAGPWKIKPGTFCNRHLGDGDFDSDTIHRQGLPGDWEASATPPPQGGFFAMQAATRDAALVAIQAVANQGEGLVDAGAGEPSHFQQFLSIYTAIKSATGPLPVLPVPTNPTYGPNPLPDKNEEKNRITDPNTRGLAELSDIHYTVLLACIHLSLLVRDDSQAGKDFRQNIAKFAIEGEMVNAIGALAVALAHSPRNPQDDPKVNAAGIPFTNPEVPDSNKGKELIDFIKGRLDASDDLIARLKGNAQPNGLALLDIGTSNQTLRGILAGYPGDS
jgi:hypothetical protein